MIKEEKRTPPKNLKKQRQRPAVIKEQATSWQYGCPICKQPYTDREAMEDKRGEIIHEDCYEPKRPE